MLLKIPSPPERSPRKIQIACQDYSLDLYLWIMRFITLKHLAEGIQGNMHLLSHQNKILGCLITAILKGQYQKTC